MHNRILIVCAVLIAACSPTEKISERPMTGAIEVSYDVKTTDPSSQPEELGDVAWIRNYDEAVAAAKKADKPIFLLFTEVPGCSTVKGFANGPLSDSRIVEAIQTEFVPLAIYNNTSGGHDAKILEKFDEPSWNNPVVRFVDASGEDISDRYARDWRKASLVDVSSKDWISWASAALIPAAKSIRSEYISS